MTCSGSVEAVAMAGRETHPRTQEFQCDALKLRVQLPMFAARADVQVAGRIVELVAVDVMDDLIVGEPSPEFLLGDENMLADVPAVMPDQAVAAVNTTAALPRWVAGANCCGRPQGLASPFAPVVLKCLVRHPQALSDGSQALTGVEAPSYLGWSDR